MKFVLLTVVAFLAGGLIVSSLGPPQPKGYYTGCELPGAVANCEEVMQQVEEYGRAYLGDLRPLRLMPPGGPTAEMKVTAIKAQLYTDSQIKYWRRVKERDDALEAERQKEEAKIEQRAGLR